MKKILAGLILLFLVNAAGALTLKESIDVALKNNPSVLASRQKVDVANAKLAQAMGMFFPSVKLNGNYGQTYSQPAAMQIGGTVISFGTSEVGTLKGLNLALSQPVFVPGLFPGFKIAQLGADIAREELRNTMQDTIYNVNVAYFGVLASYRYVKLNQESLDMAKSHQAQVEAMLNSGVVTRADLLRSQVQVENSIVALTQAENMLERSKNSFNTVLGRNIDEKVEVAEVPLSMLPKLPDKYALLETAYANRPDWKAFIYSRQVAEENLSLAQTAYLPTVLLSGQTGTNSTNYPSFGYDVGSWSISGALAWTLFDGLQITNKVREAAANLASQRSTEEQIKNNIAQEVRDAYLNLKSGLDTISSAKKAVDFAVESQKVFTVRYDSGVGTNLEVIDAQVALTQARTNYLKALFDVAVSRAKVNQVVGTEVI